MEMKVTKRALLLADDTDSFKYGIKLMEMGYPPLDSYANKGSIKALKVLEEIFGSRKNVMRYIKLFESLNDAEYYERELENKNHKTLLSQMEKDKLFSLLTKIKDKKVSFHDFVSNLPNLKKDDNYESIYNFLMKILDYRNERLMECINYMNYKKIRFAKNYDDMKKHIDIITAAKNGLVSAKQTQANLILNKSKFNITRFMNFTKESNIVNTIGTATNCCFRPGGLAQSLLKPAILSPISGIFHGEYNKGKWFSFIWEIVEFNEETNLFEINLVLDNIEASKVLDEKGYNDMVKVLRTIGYRKIYLGTSRNDTFLPDSVKASSKDKPYSLMAYEKEFARYGSYDDSKYLYTLVNNPIDTDVELKVMNFGDFHRTAYVERLVWKENNDPEFLDINVEECPSYILQSNTNIFGYLVNSIKYHYNENIYTKSDLRKIIDMRENDDYEKILYIEDMFMLPYKKCLATIRAMQNHLIEWCLVNDIKYISANFNSNSAPFLKRIKKAIEGTNITFINDNTRSAYSIEGKPNKVKTQLDLRITNVLGDVVREEEENNEVWCNCRRMWPFNEDIHSTIWWLLVSHLLSNIN